MQSEVFASTLNRQAGVNNNLWGTYVYVSYFLTGEIGLTTESWACSIA